jgi:hypothetical protein
MPKFSPQQIQQIARYLENGNPLPDKYSYLFCFMEHLEAELPVK